jgi:hypothetical protein
MAKRSRHIDEASAGKIEPGEILPVIDVPDAPIGPLRDRHGDILREVIEQPAFCGLGSQDALLARIRQAMTAKSREPPRRAVVRHSRSLRRVSE